MLGRPVGGIRHYGLVVSRLICVWGGAPGVVEALPEMNPSRLGVLGKSWESVHAFSSAAEYAYHVANPPTFNRLQVLAAHTIYNPRVSVSGEWRAIGPYTRARVLELVKTGLQHDDDIIQQWFGADEVLRLLEAADSFDEMIVAVDAIGGGPETNDQTAGFVRRVLGDRE